VAGDLVGWYSAGAGVLAYDDGRTGCAVGDEVRAPPPCGLPSRLSSAPVAPALTVCLLCSLSSCAD
jgi:hypothetical protein